MNANRFLLPAAFLVVVAAAALAQRPVPQLTGTWNAETATGGGKTLSKLLLKMEGGKLTGTLKTSFGDFPLQDGSGRGLRFQCRDSPRRLRTQDHTRHVFGAMRFSSASKPATHSADDRRRPKGKVLAADRLPAPYLRRSGLWRSPRTSVRRFFTQIHITGAS
jgi:hypothetical protein